MLQIILNWWLGFQLLTPLPPPTIVDIFRYDCRLRGIVVRLDQRREVWFDFGNCPSNPHRLVMGHWALVQVHPHKITVMDREKTRGFGLFR